MDFSYSENIWALQRWYGYLHTAFNDLHMYSGCNGAAAQGHLDDVNNPLKAVKVSELLQLVSHLNKVTGHQSPRFEATDTLMHKKSLITHCSYLSSTCIYFTFQYDFLWLLVRW